MFRGGQNLPTRRNEDKKNKRRSSAEGNFPASRMNRLFPYTDRHGKFGFPEGIPLSARTEKRKRGQLSNRQSPSARHFVSRRGGLPRSNPW